MSEVPILPDEMMKTELQSVEGFYPLSSSFFLLGVEVDLRRSRLSSVWLGQVQDNGPWALSATVASLSKGKSRLPGPSGLSATSATHTDRSTRPNTLLCPEEHGGARRFCARPQSWSTPFPLQQSLMPSSEMWKGVSRKQAESSNWAEAWQSWGDSIQKAEWSFSSEQCGLHVVFCATPPPKFVCWNPNPLCDDIQSWCLGGD